jgi:hypothetical protein
MAVKEISRRLDVHAGIEIVELEDGLGRRQTVSITVQDPDRCPHCGRAEKKRPGVDSVEKAIERVKKEMRDAEKQIRKHARKRGHKLP